MKRIILPLAALCAIACGEPTQQEVAEKNVQEYIKSKLEQPEAYKPVSFGVIDTVWTTIDEQKAYKDYQFAGKEVDRYNDLFNQFSDPEVQRDIISKMDKNVNEMNRLKPVVDSLIEHFKPEIKHLTLGHTFKGINGFGMETEDKATFRLNPVTLEVTGIE